MLAPDIPPRALWCFSTRTPYNHSLCGCYEGIDVDIYTGCVDVSYAYGCIYQVLPFVQEAHTPMKNAYSE
jgi:hypothetical protein